MPNGTAVKLPRELDPPITARTELEQRIGEVTAAAAVAIGGAITTFAADGQLSPALKAFGAEALTQVTLLQLNHPDGDTDFIATARREGLRMLWQIHGEALRGLRLDTAELDRILEEFIGGVFEITSRTVAGERALAH
jgi:hypothetical protein